MNTLVWECQLWSWHSQNFDWGGLKMEKILWRYFGNVFRWRNCDVTKM